MQESVLLLGVDGGGTQCRARLASLSGTPLGEGNAGPANLRLGLEQSFAAVREATSQCLRQAGLHDAEKRIVACLAMAGASEPEELSRAQAYTHPFLRARITTDAQAACVGAHAGADGGVIIIGTGSVGWAQVRNKVHRVGGWGFPISDEGSGAWLGSETLRRVLWAYDGIIPWSGLLLATFARFNKDPHAIVRWVATARPRDFASITPLVVAHAARGDDVAVALMQAAAKHVDAMAARMAKDDVGKIALMGGLASAIEEYVSLETRGRLVQPLGDALSGALYLARVEAEHLLPTLECARD